MDELTRLARPEIYAMKPYSSARTEGSQAASIFLDANENAYPPFPGTAAERGLNRYPEPQPQRLLRRFSALFSMPVENLFLSRGADEAIDLLLRVFCAAGRDGILITPPTFVMYETAAEIQGARVHRVPLLRPSFQLDVSGLLAAHREAPSIKLLFVCSPNNPTGNLMSRQDIVQLASSLSGRALVVVDELYLDYSGRPSLSTAIVQHPNLVVLRSVSKEYSLAGERVGITVAHKEVIGLLRRVMAPYPLAVSSIRTVEAALGPEGIEYGRANIRRILEERDRVRAVLLQSPAVSHIFPTDANFLLVQTPDAKRLTQLMADHGIKIRDRSGVVERSVRISIGTPDENARLLEVFKLYEREVVTLTA
jgi:histidinol-phosphate aminotransferase